MTRTFARNTVAVAALLVAVSKIASAAADEDLLPECPAPIYLTTPDLGDVSRGQLVTLANFNDLFKDVLNPKQLEGLRLGCADGPIKTFPLRDIKDSSPYLHDDRLLTLEDGVEFFNLVLGLKLIAQEKTDLVAFLRTL